jgi:hypothetical protein
VTEVIREEIKKFLESNENETTTYWNMWETAKAVLKRKFIAISAYIQKTETSQINKIMMYLKLLEKQEQTKPQTSKWRELIKIRVKINETKSNKLNKESIKLVLRKD